MRALRQNFPPERTLWLVGVGVALSLLGDNTLYIVLPTHTAEAGILLADVGLMLSANRLIRLFINGPYGLMLERVQRRKIVVPSLFLGAFSTLLYTLPGFWPLLIGRLLWGAAWAGIWIGGSTIVLDISTEANRGRFSGLYQMWFFIGAAVSAIAGGTLTDWLGYAPGLRVSALVTLVMAVIWWVFLPETKPDQAAHASPTPGQASPAPADSARQTRRPLLAAICVLGVNWLLFIGIVGATLPRLLAQRIGTEFLFDGWAIPLATFTGLLAAASQVIGLVASPAAGWVSDRTGSRWGPVVLSVLGGTAILAIIAAGSGAPLIAAIVLNSAAMSVIQTQVMALIGDHSRSDRQGRVLGILNTIGDLGSAAGPLLAYNLLLPAFDLAGTFWLMAGVLGLLLPWVSWL
ncbi:MAG: MFS transporter, partial [Anaerolineae bacterium]|nr:MFS transporter [Anaerolineae bacterium]